jgi:hypothetical protein
MVPTSSGAATKSSSIVSSLASSAASCMILLTAVERRLTFGREAGEPALDPTLQLRLIAVYR